MDDKSRPPPPAAETYDGEIDVRTIVGFGAGLVAVTLVVLALMWWMSVAFRHQEEANDRAASPIGEADLDPIPPGPRLQAVPPRDMDELRRADREVLTTYGWVDQAKGVARIPLERAIAILAEKGLGATPAPSIPLAPAPPSATPSSDEASPAHPALHPGGKAGHPKKGAK
jgi:hypothetical protein